MNNDLDEIEDELKKEEAEKEIAGHKVSGRSVFEIERIIKEKSHDAEALRDKSEKEKVDKQDGQEN